MLERVEMWGTVELKGMYCAWEKDMNLEGSGVML